MAPLAAAHVDPARYARDGILHPLPVMSGADAARYLKQLEAFEAEHGEAAQPILRHKGHLVLTWLHELMRHPAIVAAVSKLIGPDILCWTTNAFIKNPGDGRFVSWHQDATYWGLGVDRVVTAWIALTPSTVANGCLRVVPGSHRWDQLPHVDTHDPANLLTRGQEIAVPVREEEAQDVILAPGEMSLHHVLIAHASGPNHSSQRRIGIAFRYIAADLKQTTGLRDSAALVAGQHRFGHFDLEPAPAADMHPDAVAYYQQSIDSAARILYRGDAK